MNHLPLFINYFFSQNYAPTDPYHTKIAATFSPLGNAPRLECIKCQEICKFVDSNNAGHSSPELPFSVKFPHLNQVSIHIVRLQIIVRSQGNPVTLQCFPGSHPFVHIDNQQVADEVFGIVGNCSPVFFVEFILPFTNFAEEFALVVVDERWVAAQKNVKDDSNTPHISAFIVGNAIKNFGRHVSRCPTLSLQRLRLMHNFGKSKISYFDRRIIRHTTQQQILGFQIPMGYPVIMTISNRLQKNLAHIACLLLVIITLLHNTVKQFSAVH
mmetsp:Transcript_5723/g.12475  ORF Transcript_5723/g.12475 Transcript_5723/m.12475 type:complete len:270 (-) Transcript_5723:444-1253(-)